MKETEIDYGNFDWVVAKDGDGNVWIRPSIHWKDGEVYESMSAGKDLYKKWMSAMGDLE